MKRAIILLSFLLAAPIYYGAEQESPKVIINSGEARSLAAGYAKAFKALDARRKINVVTRRDGKLWIFEDVKNVEVIDNVLVMITTNPDNHYALDPKDIFFITDGGYIVKE